MTIHPTIFFVSVDAARRHFGANSGVDRMIADQAIIIAKPPLRPGETLHLVDDGCRYAVGEAVEPPAAVPVDCPSPPPPPPAPRWEARPVPKVGTIAIHAADNPRPIATVGGNYQTGITDAVRTHAALIAAAPDLLDVARMLVDATDSHTERFKLGDCVMRARAAIAKATRTDCVSHPSSPAPHPRR